jgi:hypothetical protein
MRLPLAGADMNRAHTEAAPPVNRIERGAAWHLGAHATRQAYYCP